MRTSHMAVWTFCGLTLIAAGCSSPHYRVTDPTSGKEYYATKIHEAGRAGAVKIKDEKSGSMVTLQSSEIKEISSDEYDAGIAAKPKAQPVESQPAPVQPPPVQPATMQPAAAEPVQK